MCKISGAICTPLAIRRVNNSGVNARPALGISALPLAQRLKAELDGEIHAPDCLSGGDASYAKATAHLAELFQQGRTIIGLCASGILIRALAPHLNDKRTEPPVVAVAEDGSSSVPLLGGHHGANTLAQKIAAITGGHAAITTASEVRFDSAFDESREGYTLANPEDMKSATASLLSGAPLAVNHSGPSTSFRHFGESRNPQTPVDLSNLQTVEWTPSFDGVTGKAGILGRNAT